MTAMAKPKEFPRSRSATGSSNHEGPTSARRVFTPEEQVDGKDFVVRPWLWSVANDARGDPNIVGNPFQLSSRPYNIVGVMGQDFHPLPATLVLPEGQFLPAVGENYDDSARDERHLRAIARLKPGATVEQARNDVQSHRATIGATASADQQRSGRVRCLITDEINRRHTPHFVLIFGAVIFVLLVACANVAKSHCWRVRL